MKNLKLIALIVAISISSLSYALPADNDPKTELHDQIVALLSGPNSPDLDFTSNELVADVIFTVNKNAELVIISVDSEDLRIEGFIKANLNYKKVKVAGITPGKIYQMPVRIIKES